MGERTWAEAVYEAIRRYVTRTGSCVFTRQALLDAELDAIIAATGSIGATPQQTLRRELQHLQDVGVLAAVGDGAYRLRDADTLKAGAPFRKGVFVLGSHSGDEDEPEQFYRFGSRWLAAAAKLRGNWILYQEPRRSSRRRYHAVAKVDRIVPDPANSDMYLALIEPGSFCEFGRDVPFQKDGRAVERGLLCPNGRLNNGRAVQPIRPISDDDFFRIIELGLAGAEEALVLSRGAPPDARLREHQALWEGPVDRSSVLTSRTVRDRQFRKRVLQAYSWRCAVTGLEIITADGLAEAEAAHVMSVEAGGPDSVSNGIALSRSVHWMFDRGLISFSDRGDILLSGQISDADRVTAAISIPWGGKARFPGPSFAQPHPRYLQWHRSERFQG